MDDPTSAVRILVADDEYGTRDLLARLLRRCGYEVVEASDGEQALQTAVSQPLDLVLADMQMPRMRGDELGRWMDQLDPDLPVVLMTAYPGYETAIAAVRCHAADFIEKPFDDLQRVVDVVERAVARRRQSMERATAAESLAERVRVDDLKRRFLSGVAHELRTPLTVVKSLAETLGRGIHGPLTTEQGEAVSQIESEADRLAHEVDKLLSLARIETQDFAPDLVPTAVIDLLSPLRTLRARAEEKRIRIGFDVDCAETAIAADRQDLPRALRALVENALEFTGEGGHVTVRALREGDGVRFSVEDTGIGIDPADHARIFEAFVQVENPLTRRHRGAGIGLAYASRVVEGHGSTIEVDSALGDGARFSFWLALGPEPVTTGPVGLRVTGGAAHA